MKLLDELNAVREKVGLGRLALDDLAANVFNSKATSYAFHFSLSKEMLGLVGSLASGFIMSVSGSPHALRTIESCVNRGLISPRTGGGFVLTRVGCAVALMLEAGKFIKLNDAEIKSLKKRI